ncbi:MAG: caspase family protein [Bacteroidota bacterium]
MRAALLLSLLFVVAPVLAQSTSPPTRVRMDDQMADRLPPTLEVRLAGTQLLQSGQIVQWQQPMLFFTGRASDRSGIRQIEVNGVPVAVGGDRQDVTFEHVVPLDTLALEGTSLAPITVRVVDAHDNEQGLLFYAEYLDPAERSAVLRVRSGEDTGRLFASMYGESHALLIGVSDYQTRWRDLPGVRRDLDAVAVALEAHGFNITRVEDPTLDELDRALDTFYRRYGNHQEDVNNRLLIYFAGHGYTMNGMGYLVPSDAPAPTDNGSGFRTGSLAMSDVRSYAEKLQSKHALFVFDACFAGSIFGGVRGGVPVGIAERTLKPVRLFIASGTEDQEVPDDSIFRQFFVRALDGEADLNQDDYITGQELGSFLYDQVTRHSDGTQTPDYGKLVGSSRFSQGDLVFEVVE